MTNNRTEIRLSFSTHYAKGLLDVTATGADATPLLVYADHASAASLHAHLGGEQRYRNRPNEPLRGEGIVPARDGLLPIECYLVDQHPARFIHFAGRRAGAGEYEIYAPVGRRSRRLAEDWPVILTRRHAVWYDAITEARCAPLYLLKPGEVLPFLNGTLRGLIGQPHGLSFIRYPSTAPNRLRLMLYATSFVREEQAAEVIRGLFARDIEMVWGGEPMAINQFSSRRTSVWTRLGIMPCSDGMYYLMKGDLAVRQFGREGLTLDVLRAEVPPDTWLFSDTPLFFIQMTPAGCYEACGVFSFNGSKEVDFEIEISSSDLEAARAGRYHHLRRRLLHGALRKYRYNRARYLTVEEVRAAARGKGSMNVTMEDSLAAGNCGPGTRAFAERFFPNRSALTVEELLPHAGLGDVLRVLAYKLGLVQYAA